MATTITTPNVLGEVDIIQIDFTIWTGAAKMETSDYVHVDPRDLPDASLASLGSLRLIDKSVLKPLNQFRTRAEKLCKGAGVRLLSGYAVPRGDVKSLMTKLTKLVADFDAAVDDFLVDYDSHVDSWIAKNETKDPAQADRIRVGKIPAGNLRRRFSHRLSVFQVTGSTLDKTNSMNSTAVDLRTTFLDSVVSDLSNFVYKVQRAPNSYFKSPVRNTLKRLATRLRRFSFLEPVAFPAFACSLEHAAAGEGTMQDLEYRQLAELINTIDDAQSLEAVMQSCVNATAPQSNKLQALPDIQNEADQTVGPKPEETVKDVQLPEPEKESELVDTLELENPKREEIAVAPISIPDPEPEKPAKEPEKEANQAAEQPVHPEVFAPEETHVAVAASTARRRGVSSLIW